MRCPDCSKFVGLENQDPEINSLEAEFADEQTVSVSVSARHVRACADCGTELKAVDCDDEQTVEVSAFEGYTNLNEAQKAGLKIAIDGRADAELEVEEGGASADEGGGGRYKKNIVTVIIPFTVTLTADPEPEEGWEKISLTHSGEFKFENAASSYDEQV